MNPTLRREFIRSLIGMAIAPFVWFKVTWAGVHKVTDSPPPLPAQTADKHVIAKLLRHYGSFHWYLAELRGDVDLNTRSIQMETHGWFSLEHGWMFVMMAFETNGLVAKAGTKVLLDARTFDVVGAEDADLILARGSKIRLFDASALSDFMNKRTRRRNNLARGFGPV